MAYKMMINNTDSIILYVI